MSCRRVAAFPWHDGLSPSCDRRQWRAVLWQESVAQRSGAGLARTHCVRGAIAAGYSRAIRSLPAKPAVSSISTNVGGKVQRWGRAITCSASTRRPASKQDGANIVHCRPAPGRPIYVEHEYARAGALAYLAAWDVQRAKLFGRCERKNGIAAFERLIVQVMRRQPYRSARRVFLIADNGSSHRGQPASDRLRAKWPNIVLVHTPVHASWLNQIEVYFSVVQRKLLTPSDFANRGRP